MKNTKKNKVISLFSGCGGMDLGFMLAGFDVVWAVDKDPIACQTYSFNLSDNIQCKDICSIDPNVVPDADVLISGPPCQGFSTVGKRDPKDSRNSLYLDVLRIVRVKKPKFVVIENVKGLKSFRRGVILRRLTKGLEEMGYHVQWGVLNAKDFGIPQNRERLIIIAQSSSLKKIFNFDNLINGHKSVTLKEAIGDIEDLRTLPNHIYNGNGNEIHKVIISKIKQGQKLCDTRLGIRSVHTWQIPQVFGKVTPLEKEALVAIAKFRRKKDFVKEASWNDASPLTLNEIKQITDGTASRVVISSLMKKGYVVKKGPGLFDLKHTFNGKFRRLDYSRPSEAVLTNFGSARNYIHPAQDRPLTIRECARIQTFPDGFIFQGSVHGQYRQVGNAVPPQLSHTVATEIANVLSNTQKKNAKRMPFHFTGYVVNQILQKLKKYGSPDLGNLKNPLDELIYLYISQRTVERSYIAVFKKLKNRYSTFEKLRRAKEEDLIRIIEPSGLGRQKARTIITALNKIKNDFNETSLNRLKTFDDKKKLEYLLTLPRVGIKTAYCLLMFSFGVQVLPIDANVRRVCQRLGLLPRGIDAEKEHSMLHSIIAPDERHSFHVNCISHARQICIPLHPKCDKCIIRELCERVGVK